MILLPMILIIHVTFAILTVLLANSMIVIAINAKVDTDGMIIRVINLVLPLSSQITAPSIAPNAQISASSAQIQSPAQFVPPQDLILHICSMSLATLIAQQAITRMTTVVLVLIYA